jgi:hypothetical protein
LANAVSRPKIARALAVDTCWPTMIEARLSNPGSESRSGTSPAASRIACRRGSMIISASSPVAMSSRLRMRCILLELGPLPWKRGDRSNRGMARNPISG